MYDLFLLLICAFLNCIIIRYKFILDVLKLNLILLQGKIFHTLHLSEHLLIVGNLDSQGVQSSVTLGCCHDIRLLLSTKHDLRGVISSEAFELAHSKFSLDTLSLKSFDSGLLLLLQ